MNSIVALPIAAATAVATPSFATAPDDAELLSMIDRLWELRPRYHQIYGHFEVAEKEWFKRRPDVDADADAAMVAAQVPYDAIWNEISELERRIFATEAKTLAGIKAKARWHLQFYCDGDIDKLDPGHRDFQSLFLELSEGADGPSSTPAKAAHTQLTTVDPIFARIEAHKAAEKDYMAAVHHEGVMEQTIEQAKRKGNAYSGEVTVVATDDPRWTEAFVRTNDTWQSVEAAALRMLEEPPASLAGVVALLDYAVEYVKAGNCWPQDLEDEEKACRNFLGQTPWQHYVIANTAEVLRGLTGAPTPAGVAPQAKIAA